MSTKGISSFNRTVQTTSEWLNQFQNVARAEDEQAAYRRVKAGLHGLRDRLSALAASDLAAQVANADSRVLLRGMESRRGSQNVS